MFSKRVGASLAVLLLPCSLALAGKDDVAAAAALKQHGLTLAKCIETGAGAAGGPAVFANVNVGKKGKFRVNVDAVVSGKRVTKAIDESGKVAKKGKNNRGRKNQQDYPEIAKQLTAAGATLAELVTAAEQSAGGTATNAWGFVEDGKVLVRVVVVTGDKSEKIVMDPKTKKPQE